LRLVTKKLNFSVGPPELLDVELELPPELLELPVISPLDDPVPELEDVELPPLPPVPSEI